MGAETTRVCCMCRIEKPLEEFHRDKNRRLGRDYGCKVCRKFKYNTVRYPALKKNESYKAKHRLNVRKHIDKYPDRQKARLEASRYKQRLLKDACEKCGSNTKLHMHHLDYSKPLEVVTLCVPCHELMHHGSLV